MGLFSKKRGSVASKLVRSRKGDVMHEIYFLMFQVAMILLVGLALFQYINNVATDLGFEKKFTSLDIGMLTTTIESAPGTLMHTYVVPVLFPTPIDFIFGESTINIKERGKELNMYYWYLADSSIDLISETVPIEAYDVKKIAAEMAKNLMASDMAKIAVGSKLLQMPSRPNMTYYKTGRQVGFSKDAENPLQLTCPLMNTSVTDWMSKKIYVAKVLPKKEDYSNASLPVNRIAQVLAAKHPQVKVSGTGSGGAQQVEGSSLISVIPADAEIVIILGDSGEKREPGSLVAYIPVNDNLMKERKFACFLLNDLLTPKSVVFYAQIMPVYVDTLDKKSPLKVFSELSNKNQIAVFIDISKFSAEQVDVESSVEAIYRAIARYYGISVLPAVQKATLSFTGAGVGSQTVQGSITPTTSGTYGKVLTKAEKDVIIASIAKKYGFEHAVLSSFIAVESGGSGFNKDGTLVIRMEPHKFNEYCKCTDGTWGSSPLENRAIGGVSCEGGQEKEYMCFKNALVLNESAAYQAISMGLPQIMGFNSQSIGYPSAKAMFDDFSKSESVQLEKFGQFIAANPKLSEAIKSKDWAAMGRIYNGDTKGVYEKRLLANYVPDTSTQPATALT